MGIHRLFLSKDAEGMVGLSAKYTYAEETLTITSRGETRGYYFPKQTAISIICDGRFPEPNILMAPQRLTDKLQWLCGINKQKRSSSIYDYERRVASYQALPDAKIVMEMQGAGWRICEAERSDGSGFFTIASWCSENITASGIRSLLSSHLTPSFPEWYVMAILDESRNAVA